MKLPILFFGTLVCMGAAFAEDEVAPKLVERKTCVQIKAEMDDINYIENPDEAMQATLKQLQTQYRNNCMPKSAGRRKVIRNVSGGANPQKMADTIAATSDALSEYLASKKANCEKLNAEIEKMATANDDSKSDTLASMRGIYDMDCAEKPAGPEPMPAVPEKSEEELNAEYDANLAAGLCGDGTKPNRYGCCTGETFKDLGNTTFACCPKAGGVCFPPIK